MNTLTRNYYIKYLRVGNLLENRNSQYLSYHELLVRWAEQDRCRWRRRAVIITEREGEETINRGMEEEEDVEEEEKERC